MAFWGRRVGLVGAAVVMLTVTAIGDARAGGEPACPDIGPGPGESHMRGALPPQPSDWVLLLLQAGPAGARQLDSAATMAFDDTHGFAFGVIAGGRGDIGPVADIGGLNRPATHNTVRVGSTGTGVVLHQRERGRQYDVSGSIHVRNAQPCEVVAALVFLPGGRLMRAAHEVRGGAGRSMTIVGRGGAALLASESTKGTGVSAGSYAGRFTAEFPVAHGLVGGVSHDCEVCRGEWTPPQGQPRRFRVTDDPTFEVVGGGPGRWVVQETGVGVGSRVTPVSTAPVFGAWADVGPVRRYLNING